MTKPYISLAAVALLSAFTAACDSGPPARVAAETPEWTQNIHVNRVSKTRSTLTTASGEQFTVRSRSPQDIGDGLHARRGTRRLYISDSNGVECLWRSNEQLSGCTKPNPDLKPQ